MAKKLYRSNNQKIIVGVCGGIGEYFDLDPVIIRILFLIAFFSAGVGFLAYIIMWVIVPRNDFRNNNEATQTDNQQFRTQSGSESIDAMRKIFGISLLAIGVISLLDNILPMIDLNLAFPILLLVSGFVILFNGKKSNNTEKEGYEIF